MAGIDRATGRLLDGWPHVVQSIVVIITTTYGERMRAAGSDRAFRSCWART
jgi:phage baseplate assembly protein W